LQLHQLELRLAAQFLVERRERFIEQKDARALHQRARERNALALAAGELVRLALAQAFEPDQREHLLDPRRDFSLRKPLLLESERDVALDREMRKQSVALEHHVDRPPIRRYPRRILTVRQDASLLPPVPPRQQ